MPQLGNIQPRWRMLPFGLLLFTFGTIKKVVLADGIGGWVDQIYSSPEPLTMGESLIAIYGFTVQIYCDFSGYSDIAIGAAAILGFKIPLNFNKPFFATSPSDFWSRWHISLSTWVRDYLYYPLVFKNRKSDSVDLPQPPTHSRAGGQAGPLRTGSLEGALVLE